jgi:3-oxoacyl-[acyl-carrier-protein] synthase-1
VEEKMERQFMSMRDVWIAADCIISPLGNTTEENYRNILEGKTGISLVNDASLFNGSVHASVIAAADMVIQNGASGKSFTKFESISIRSIANALKKIQLDTTSDRTLFILSSTKGNIELLTDAGYDARRIHLAESAGTIANYFGNTQQSPVVSNACISGVMAILVAKRYIQSGQYDHVVVTGADVLTKFVLSGFQSLSAISPEPCKPFDAKRKGVSLGEAAATIILSTNPASIKGKKEVKIIGGGLSNDANHISGPSRSGEELADAINIALEKSGLTSKDVDFISAHGTATLYNDEMEAKAFNLAGLATVPLNSLKGYFGHTLGAAGILESIISQHALTKEQLIPTFGFDSLGVSQPVKVIHKIESKKITTCLKTASGFGGCNAAVVLKKFPNDL